MRSAVAPFLGGCLGAVAGTLLLAAAVRRAGQQYDRAHEATREAVTRTLARREDEETAALRRALKRVARLTEGRRWVSAVEITLALSKVTATAEGDSNA